MIAVMCGISPNTVRSIIKDKRVFYKMVAKFVLYSTCIFFLRAGRYPKKLGRPKETSPRTDRRIARDVCLIYVVKFLYYRLLKQWNHVKEIVRGNTCVNMKLLQLLKKFVIYISINFFNRIIMLIHLLGLFEDVLKN